MVKFSNRKQLVTHLIRGTGGRSGTGICLLNTILRTPALSEDDLREALRSESVLSLARTHAGLGRHLCVHPAHRAAGPLYPIIGFNGAVLSEQSNLHPFGLQKRKYLPLADIDSDESCSDLE